MELAKSQLIKPTFSIFDFPSPLYPWSVYVVVNFLSQIIFVFLLFLGVVMYANEVETKEKEKLPEVKNFNCNIYTSHYYSCNCLGGRAWGGDLTFFKNLPSNSLPTGKSFQSNATKFPHPRLHIAVNPKAEPKKGTIKISPNKTLQSFINVAA